MASPSPHQPRHRFLNLTAYCGRVVTEKEIKRAVENSRLRRGPPVRTPERAILCWPNINHEQREAIIAAMGMELADLWEISPIRFLDNVSHTEEIIDVLFPGNPLLCCGKNNFEFATLPREEWRGRLGCPALSCGRLWAARPHNPARLRGTAGRYRALAKSEPNEENKPTLNTKLQILPCCR